MTRIKRITSHAGYGRYLANEIMSDENGAAIIAGYIPRQKDIPSPYAYSPTHIVWLDVHGRTVIIVETKHKTYDVFGVPSEMIHAQEESAQNLYLQNS
jgi:hypothetical protein